MQVGIKYLLIVITDIMQIICVSTAWLFGTNWLSTLASPGNLYIMDTILADCIFKSNTGNLTSEPHWPHRFINFWTNNDTQNYFII